MVWKRKVKIYLIHLLQAKKKKMQQTATFLACVGFPTATRGSADVNLAEWLVLHWNVIKTKQYTS